MGMTRKRAAALAWTFFLFTVPAAQGGILRSNKVLLLCHRTANRDLPENTLESLSLAAHMGCDIVEVDVRRTADDELVLNHDGFLDRFTDTTGEVENTDLRELERMDFGAWMGRRFSGMHIAQFEDAVRLARELNIGLYLDLKTKGIGPQVLAVLARQGMTNKVIFGGEWDDIHRLDPAANDDPVSGLEPGFTREQVEALHRKNRIVIANFILNGHEFDVKAMKQAVAFGVNGIMVDYPRLGAEAVGRPVEQKIEVLSKQAETGPTDRRVRAIRELSYYIGLPLQQQFLHWLMDSDQRVSHEAALALVVSRPPPPLASFEAATHSHSEAARSNAAWAIGALARSASDGTLCATTLAPMLRDADTIVIEQALVGLSRCAPDPQAVPVDALLHILSGNVPVLRGLAAVALAKHHPDIAERKVAEQLEKEEEISNSFNADWTARGRPKLPESDIGRLVELFRAEMKELQALEMLPGEAALHSLASQAFRPGHDYSMAPIEMAGFSVWDRLADDPAPAIQVLASNDNQEADWAEWALVKAGPAVFPAIQSALPMSQGETRVRLIQILGWRGNREALPVLRSMEGHDRADGNLIRWAIREIEAFQPTADRP